MRTIIQIFAVTCLFLVSLELTAHNHNSPNATLSVSATSGLNMRTVPGIHGKIVKTLQVGDQVTMIHDELGLGYTDRIDWVDGEWILVEHNDDLGYVFDGYLTNLPIPSEDDEFTCLNMDLSTSIEAYAKNNFTPEAAPDTLLGSTIVLSQKYVEGHTLTLRETFYDFRTELKLNEVSVMEAYHILFAMLSSKPEQISFIQNSTFIEDDLGKIRRVSIKGDHPITITKQENKTLIKVLNHQTECNL